MQTARHDNGARGIVHVNNRNLYRADDNNNNNEITKKRVTILIINADNKHFLLWMYSA